MPSNDAYVRMSIPYERSHGPHRLRSPAWCQRAMSRHRAASTRAPASSANLGPGYDALAAALSNVILNAALLTAFIFCGLTAAVFMTRADFSFLRTALMVAGVAALGGAVLAVIASGPKGAGRKSLASRSTPPRIPPVALLERDVPLVLERGPLLWDYAQGQ